MKVKFVAALAATGCVLAVSPANALSVTINPGATFTSVPGAVLFDDFDSIQNTAIGTITGGVLNEDQLPPPIFSPAISSQRAMTLMSSR